MSIYFENKKEYHKGIDADSMIGFFINELSSRTSCYSCKFKGKDRISDFTIGDFWKVEQMLKDLNDNKGVTILVVHSQKGEKLLNNIKDILELRKIDLDEALKLNGGEITSMMLEPAKMNSRREEFFKDLNTLSYEQVMDKYHPVSLKTKFKYLIKPILYKTNLIKIIRK